LITTPNTTCWLSRLHFLLSGTFLHFQKDSLAHGHINPVSPFELNLIMERTGLQEVEIRAAGTLPPVYCSGLKNTVASLLALVFRPVQSGILNGWCVIATGKK
jgi:hypothetical protein